MAFIIVNLMQAQAKKLNFFNCGFSPNKDDAGTWIYQNAWISIVDLSHEHSLNYSLHLPNNGVYIIAIEGEHQIGEQTLNKRDAIGISECETIHINNIQPGRLLLVEVPMIF